MHKIYVLGMGPGSLEYVLPITTDKILESDVLIGGRRNLQHFESLNKEKIYIGADLESIITYAKEQRKNKKIAFLLSGDTGFYSMLKSLKQHFTSSEMVVIPGISSFQYLMARIGEPWQDAFVGSLHGRSFDMIKIVKNYEKVILLTDPINSPKRIASMLIEHDLADKTMVVGSNLSYENEMIFEGKPKQVLELQDLNMSVVVIKDGEDPVEI